MEDVDPYNRQRPLPISINFSILEYSVVNNGEKWWIVYMKRLPRIEKTIGNGWLCKETVKGTDPLASYDSNFTAANGEFPGEKGQRVGK